MSKNMQKYGIFGQSEEGEAPHPFHVEIENTS